MIQLAVRPSSEEINPIGEAYDGDGVHVKGAGAMPTAPLRGYLTSLIVNTATSSAAAEQQTNINSPGNPGLVATTPHLPPVQAASLYLPLPAQAEISYSLVELGTIILNMLQYIFPVASHVTIIKQNLPNLALLSLKTNAVWYEAKAKKAALLKMFQDELKNHPEGILDKDYDCSKTLSKEQQTNAKMLNAIFHGDCRCCINAKCCTRVKI